MFVGGFLFWVALNSCGKSEKVTPSPDPNANLLTIHYVQRSETHTGRDEQRLLKWGPSSVEVHPTVVRSDDGQGYTLKLDWSFKGTAPTSWRINFYSDRNDGVDELVYRTTALDTGLHYESPVLGRARKYKVEVSAFIDHRLPLGAPAGDAIVGSVVYSEILINLKGTTP
jgi:hypothetical protein